MCFSFLVTQVMAKKGLILAVKLYFSPEHTLRATPFLYFYIFLWFLDLTHEAVHNTPNFMITMSRFMTQNTKNQGIKGPSLSGDTTSSDLTVGFLDNVRCRRKREFYYRRMWPVMKGRANIPIAEFSRDRRWKKQDLCLSYDRSDG